MTPTPLHRIAHFETLAYGLFVHWGLYSQLGAGEWVMQQRKIPKDQYNRLQKTFTAADFDARALARLTKSAGMRYITLTTRHHEGFSLYDTRGLSSFDAVHSPAGRDLVAEFVAACRVEDIVPFFYHTTIDWQWWKPDVWSPVPDGGPEFQSYLDYLHASVEILCRYYGPIGGLWFDGNWAHPNADWKEDRLYSMIRQYQPDAMIINNTGIGAEGATGHPEIDSVTFEQGLPTAPDRQGWKKYLAGEMCQTMNSHWGIGGRDFDYLSPGQIIQNLAVCRKVGANYLLNIGPTASGAIPHYEKATLERVGQWVEVHAAAIYDARPCEVQAKGRDFVLRNGATLYYFAHELSREGDAHVTVAGGGAGPRPISRLNAPIQSAQWLDSGQEIQFAQNFDSGSAILNLTGYPYGSNLIVRIAKIQLSN